MTIAFNCVCGKAFSVTDDYAGQTGTCPQCKMPVTVPGEPPRAAQINTRGPRFPREQLMAYLRAHQSTNVLLLHPHIPPEREARAHDFFGIAAEDRVLAGLHPSLLIAGEETLLLTETGIYVKKADLTKGYVQYESLLEGSIHLEDGRDIVIQATKPQRLRYRVLVSPNIAENLSKVLRGLQLLLNGRDPSPIFAEGNNNALAELRAERQGLLPSSSATGNGASSAKSRGGLLGVIKRRG
ncbi:MAG: hypothetical protein JNK74_24230 [Candidatus Hydrogenedentes bacterium]|nr:hypothetical protein [Candidatus Hydrogenedentota bacterium]